MLMDRQKKRTTNFNDFLKLNLTSVWVILMSGISDKNTVLQINFIRTLLLHKVSSTTLLEMKNCVHKICYENITSPKEQIYLLLSNEIDFYFNNEIMLFSE